MSDRIPPRSRAQQWLEWATRLANAGRPLYVHGDDIRPLLKFAVDAVAENTALRADLAQVQQRNEDLESNVWERVLAVGVGMLEHYYPPDIFTGVSGDPGPTYVVALRDALKRQQTAEAALTEARAHLQETERELVSARIEREQYRKVWKDACAKEGEARAALARKEQENAELQANLDMLHGRRFSERVYVALHDRAERAEAALARVQALQEEWAATRVLRRRDIQALRDTANDHLADLLCEDVHRLSKCIGELATALAGSAPQGQTEKDKNEENNADTRVEPLKAGADRQDLPR